MTKSPPSPVLAPSLSLSLSLSLSRTLSRAALPRRKRASASADLARSAGEGRKEGAGGKAGTGRRGGQGEGGRVAWIAESARQVRGLSSPPLLSSLRSNLLPPSLLSLWSRGRRNQKRKRAGANEDAREEGEEAALSHSVTRSLSRSLSVNANKAAGERASLGVCDSANRGRDDFDRLE